MTWGQHVAPVCLCCPQRCSTDCTPTAAAVAGPHHRCLTTMWKTHAKPTWLPNQRPCWPGNDLCGPYLLTNRGQASSTPMCDSSSVIQLQRSAAAPSRLHDVDTRKSPLSRELRRSQQAAEWGEPRGSRTMIALQRRLQGEAPSRRRGELHLTCACSD